MAYSDSLRHFPIVKVVPLNVLHGESERVTDTALGAVVFGPIEWHFANDCGGNSL